MKFRYSIGKIKSQQIWNSWISDFVKPCKISAHSDKHSDDVWVKIFTKLLIKEMQWATKACNSVLVFTQLVGFLFVGCRLKDYRTFVILPSVWMNDFCPYFAWLGSIIMCSLAHKPWNHLLTQLTVKGGVSVLATENKRRRRIKIRKIPNRKTALLLSEFFSDRVRSSLLF